MKGRESGMENDYGRVWLRLWNFHAARYALHARGGHCP